MISNFSSNVTSSSSGSSTGQDLAIDRKSLKRPDGFMTVVGDFFGQIFTHARGLLLLLVVLLGIGLAATAYFSHRQQRVEASRNALFQAQKTLETETKAVSSAFSKVDVEKTFPESLKKLQAIDSQYSEGFGRTHAGYEAQVILGNLFYNHGEAAKALPWFEKAEKSGVDHFEKALALMAKAYAYEALHQSKEAVEAFQKALNLGEGSLKGDLLMGIARNYEALHDTMKARNTYEQVISEFPNTEASKFAEIFKNQLK